MAYWLDDGFDTWPETVRAGKAAAGLYVCCGAWIARGISNGTLLEAVIPAEVATMYGTPEWVAKLVAVGLWRVEGAGYRDVRYHSMGNPTAEKAAEKKAQKKARQEKWLAKQPKTGRKTVSSQSRDASQVGSKDMPPSLPPSKEGRESAPASPGGARSPLDARPPSPIEDVENPDWRRGRAAGVEPDANELDRRQRGAAAARASIGTAPKARHRPGPVEAARQRGSSLDSLAAAVVGLPPLVEPAADPPEEPLAPVFPIRRPAEAGTRHQEQP